MMNLKHRIELLLMGLMIAARLPADTLPAIVDLSSTVASTWAYTVYNSEPPGNSNFIDSFGLALSAPIEGVTAPSGWDVVTDYATYVYWFSGDTSLPYPDDIAPGAELSGFSVYAPGDGSTSEAYSLTAWDHTLDQPGATGEGFVFGPGPPSLDGTPEIGTFAMVFVSLLIVAGLHITSRRLWTRKYQTWGRSSLRETSRIVITALYMFERLRTIPGSEALDTLGNLSPSTRLRSTA